MAITSIYQPLVTTVSKVVLSFNINFIYIAKCNPLSADTPTYSNSQFIELKVVFITVCTVWYMHINRLLQDTVVYVNSLVFLD